MNMYMLIMVHSLWRWLVLITALLAIAGTRVALDRGLEGFGGKTGLYYLMVIDVQVLLGLIIWTIERGWLLNAFFAYVHPVTMVAALLVAHLGRWLQKRAKSLKPGLWPFVLSLALVLMGIPWFK